MPKGVIFDVDGTVVSLVFEAKRTRNEMIAELASMGFDTSTLNTETPTMAIMQSARSQVVSGSVALGYEDVRRRLYSILDESEIRTAPSATILPGANETLKILKDKSIRVAAMTNSGRRACSHVLEKNGLLGFFEFLVTRDDVREMKPDPEGLHKAVKTMSLNAQEVFYVGDSLMDIAAAKKAGVPIVSVSTGNYPAERLREAGAEHVLESLQHLPAFLGL